MSDWSERYHTLDYDSSVAMRYHCRRKAFLDILARLDPALSVVLGGTAFATVITGHPDIAASAGLAVAVISALNLAFNLSDRARLHEDLFREWGGILADLAVIADGDDTALRKLEAQRARLDARSPWQLLALSAICENEEKIVRRSGALYRIGGVQRSLANLFTLPWWRQVEDREGTSHQIHV